jgi:hypothetical protein
MTSQILEYITKQMIASYTMGTWVLSLGVKLTSPPFSAEVKNYGLYLHSLIYLYGVMLN